MKEQAKSYPIYHFSCGCDIPADKVKRSWYNPTTQQNEMRCFCPDHLGARLVEKTVYCQCGCNKPFRIKSRCNNKKYHPDCADRVKLEKRSAWHKKHKPPAYVAPPKISPVQRKNKPFEPGDVGMVFPTGFRAGELDEIVRGGVLRGLNLS